MTNLLRTVRSRPAAGAAAALVLALGLAACGGTGQAGPGGTGLATSEVGGSRSVQTPTQTRTDTDVEADLAEVLADPGSYDGQRVTTSGTAQQLAPGFVALTPAAGTGGATGTASSPDPAASGGAQSLVSPGASPGAPAAQQLFVLLPQGTDAPTSGTVTVTGVLRQPFDVTSVEQDFGVTVDPQVLQQIGVGDAAAVLVAQEVRAGGPTSDPAASPSPSTTG